ncbi:PAS domain S-box-containing protein [Desulfotomaculum arcticum]|uniref:Stage 0 sporulation protein A homolog n=1 Tax=Desulfotruncus arcticus DSM 17038 TaxID=1121424 RepID=A0A1I2YWV0_9FIRM|nr:PAS domain S-box protein [Desulfotruncus arcticus]SFH29749.1 PAS domain S-box-containing protein [Desulfotomaculum arcticum] [Desulfotruncus arcticus DSM 17038]
MAEKLLRVLIVEDSEDDMLLLLRELRRGGYDPAYEQVWTGPAMSKALETREWDLIISDYVMPSFNGLTALKLMKEHGYEVPFIILSGQISEEIAVETMKAGAHDYIFKGNMGRLIPAIDRELREAEVRRENRLVGKKLQASEERFYKIFNASPDLMIIIDLETQKIIEVNESWLKVTGLRRESVIGRTRNEFNMPTLLEDLQKLWHLLLEQGEVHNLEMPLYNNIAKTGILLVSANIIDLDDRKCVLILAKEITKYKQMEEEVQNSRIRYSTVFNHAIIGMAVLNAEGLILESNPALQSLLGYSEQELRGIAFTELTHPDDIKKDLDLYSKLIAGKWDQYQLEKRYIRKDGKMLWAKLSASVVRSSLGDPVFIIRMVENITERKHAEKELDNFFDLSLDMLCIFDTKGYVHRINSAIEKILGYTKDDLIARQITDFVHPEDLEKTKGLYQHLNAGKPVIKLNNRYFCRDGSTKWLEWVAVYDPTQELIYAVARDVTERKQLEKEMLRLERLNLVGEMAAGISHEVRNPMTTIRGFLQLLSGKEECAHYKGYYNLMIEELDRANSIITEFLSLGRNKETKLKMQNLNDIITTLLPLIQADAMRMDKYIETQLNAVPDLMLNDKELRQLILNLTRNGLEAMPQSGVVTISTYTTGQGVCLEVQDQGKGMSPEVIEKLGTPFFTTKDQGTGLGMAVCYGIAARHNARIGVTSGTGGTTFIVRFPAG